MSKTEIISMLQNNSKRSGGSRLKNHKYSVQVPEDLSTIKLAPQAIAIVGIILEWLEEAEEPQIVESELFDLLEPHKELSAKQEPWKVFKYYQKKIEEAGFLTKIVD